MWERIGRGELLLRCGVLGGARRFGAHRGRRGAGHIVAAALLQLVKTWLMVVLCSFNVFYADDLLLLAPSWRDLQFLVNLLVAEVDAIGLQSVNAKKAVTYLSRTLTLARCCLSNISVHDFCRFRCLTFYMLSLKRVYTAVLYILTQLYVTLGMNVSRRQEHRLYSIGKAKHVTVR